MATTWKPTVTSSVKATIAAQKSASNLSKPASVSTLTVKPSVVQSVAAYERASYVGSGYSSPTYYTPATVPTSAPTVSSVPVATKPVTAPIVKADGSDRSKTRREPATLLRNNQRLV